MSMLSITPSEQENKKQHSLYMQLMFVTIAFALMVVVSNIFVNNLLMNYLERDAKSVLMQTGLRIESELREPETLMLTIAEEVRHILMNSGERSDVLDYYKRISDIMIDKTDGFAFSGIQSYFDVFDGEYISYPHWDTPGDYDATIRPWYHAAIEANGKTVASPMYLSAHTNEYQITYVCQIFNENGDPLGVIGLNVPLYNITNFVVDARITENGYGFLTTENHEIIVHPEMGFTAIHIREINPSLDDIFILLRQGMTEISRFESDNYEGVDMIGYCERLENGWYLNLVTPRGEYYRDFTTLIVFFSVFGIILLVTVYIILIRIDTSYRKKREQLAQIQQAREADELTQHLLDAAPIGATVVNTDYNLIMANEELVRLFGLSDKQELCDKYFTFSPEFQPDGSLSSEQSMKYIKEAFEKGSRSFEWMHQKPNGELMPCEVTLVRMAHKDRYIVTGYTRDLRTEKRMLAEIRNAVEVKEVLANIENILNGINALIYVSDPDTDELLFVSKSIQEILNLDDSCIGKPCYKIMLKEMDSRCDFCPCDKLDRDSDEVLVWEHENNLINRIYRNTDRFIDWPNGNRVHLQYSVDVTEMREIYNELENQNKRMKLIVDSMKIALWDRFLDPDTESGDESSEIWWSDELRALLGFTDENDFPNQLSSWLNQVYSEDLPMLVSALEEYENDPEGDVLVLVYRMFLKTGECRWFRSFGATIRDEDGKPLRVVGATEDITERHEAERKIAEGKEQLEAALSEAQEANQAKSAFLATMSHEIRTPMNAILGIAEIQLQEECSRKEREEALEKIYDSGHLLLNIINDILDLSKIEAGRLEIVPIKYDVPSLINDAVQLNRLRYDSKPIELYIEVDENTPQSLYGDERRLKQILNNILSNAFKYTDQGEVKMSVSAEPIAGNDSDVMLVLRVSDTGQGMTEEQLHTLFDEYTRFNIEANRTTIGTGLGMNITKRLVDLMDGEIQVESELDKGTVFTVRLPQKLVDSLVCGKDIAKRLKDFRFQNSSISKKSRMLREYMPYGSVLVVDDVESNIYVTRGMLVPYGLQIDTASSGFEAIDKVRNGKIYDIIFMDHMMPKMDGIEATKIIRDMGYQHNIVALTANALVGHDKMFLQSGFNGYISKPIDSRELNSVLNELIRDKNRSRFIKVEQKEKKELSELERLVLMDAESAMMVMEDLYATIDNFSSSDMELYETTVHGVKSALANIGEKKLSAMAYTLELAAKERELSIIKEKTPDYISTLKSFIESFKT